MEAKLVPMNGKDFRILPFTGLKALNLDRKIIQIAAPALGPLIGQVSSKGLEGDVDLSRIGDGISQALGTLTDDAFEALITELLSQTEVKDSKGTWFPVLSVFEYAFDGKNLNVYRLIFEVMKANQFSFFGLAEIGGFVTRKTDGSAEQPAGKNGFKLSTETSAG